MLLLSFLFVFAFLGWKLWRSFHIYAINPTDTMTLLNTDARMNMGHYILVVSVYVILASCCGDPLGCHAATHAEVLKVALW